MKTIAFCEIEPFCRRVLAKHWPEVPCFEDVTTAQFPEADVICGGFPCQDVSRAGPRTGLSGARSGLYRELVRAIRLVRPRHAVMENVAALLDDGMGTVLGDVAESGHDAEWDCIPACAVGAPHERDRVWIVTHAQSDGRGQGRPGRPPDSFAGIRDEARRNAADPNGARLAFGQGFRRDAQQEQEAAERGSLQDVGQSLWPDEPALLGVDDGVPDRVERVRAIGNSLVPKIPEEIGRSIMKGYQEQ